jgi:hypothetical protein
MIDKEAKLAAALRANLRKRKAQQRERAALAADQPSAADGREAPIEARPTSLESDRKDL